MNMSNGKRQIDLAADSLPANGEHKKLRVEEFNGATVATGITYSLEAPAFAAPCSITTCESIQVCPEAIDRLMRPV